MAVKRINFLNVPIDILSEEDTGSVVMELLKKDGVQQIVFLTVWDLLKARRNNEFREMVTSAALCLPISKSILRGAKFLKKDVPVRRSKFNVIISLLNAINNHYKSLYILGGSKESLCEAEKNVRSTFSSIQIVGRFSGYYKRAIEPNIISAISKAAPSLVIVSSGINGDSKWIYRNKKNFRAGIFIHDKDIVDIFSKIKKKPSETLFDKGLEYLPQILKNPLRLLNFFKYFWFNILLIIYRIKGI